MWRCGAAEAQRPEPEDPEPLHEDCKAPLHPIDNNDVRVGLLGKPGPPPPEHLRLCFAQMDAGGRRGPRARLAPGEDVRLGGCPRLCLLLLLLLLMVMMMMMMMVIRSSSSLARLLVPGGVPVMADPASNDCNRVLGS